MFTRHFLNQDSFANYCDIWFRYDAFELHHMPIFNFRNIKINYRPIAVLVFAQIKSEVI